MKEYLLYIIDSDIVSSSREILEKFIRELHRLTTYVKITGILFVRCIGINMDYTMSISLLILKLLAADSTHIGVGYMVTYSKKYFVNCWNVLMPICLYNRRRKSETSYGMIYEETLRINCNI